MMLSFSAAEESDLILLYGVHLLKTIIGIEEAIQVCFGRSASCSVSPFLAG